MNPARRLAELERRFKRELAWLTMPDGTLASIAYGDNIWSLLSGAAGHIKLNAQQAADLEKIRVCTEIREPGGAHMINMIQIVFQGRLEAEANSAEIDSQVPPVGKPDKTL